MFTLQCKKCSHTNWIEQPLKPDGQPLQDWFCKKCDNKLFSVSFKDPIHPDTVPIQCSKCKKDLYCKFNTDDKSSTQTSWSCNACKTTAAKLKIERKIVLKTSSPSRVSNPQDTKKLPANKMANDAIQIFLSKYWRLIGLVAIVALIWVSISDNTSTNYPRKTAPVASATKTQNVYRGTQVAKSEFYKYSKSQRRRIQLFLKNNFGYKSTIDGLWGPQTANSFLRAANRYARGKSLKPTSNVKSIFNVALSNQKSAPLPKQRAQTPSSVQNNLGLTNQQYSTYRFLYNTCPIAGSPEAFSRCVRNAFCQAKMGRNCEPEKTETTCYLHRGLGSLPDRLVCN